MFSQACVKNSVHGGKGGVRGMRNGNCMRNGNPTGMHSCTIYFQVARFELKSLQEVKSLEVAEFLGFLERFYLIKCG